MKTSNRNIVVRFSLCAAILMPAGVSLQTIASADEPGRTGVDNQTETVEKPGDFTDDPAAHALYDQMKETIRNADTLSYSCQYQREAVGRAKTACTYRVWLKKPNYFRMETQSRSGEKGGVLIGDGRRLWIYWPNGRPRWPSVMESEKDEKSRFSSYMTKAAPQGKHSIWHEALLLGGGMSFPILESSEFHGYVDVMERHLDGVRSHGSETVAGVACDKIEVSLLNGQRKHYLWLSKHDHLPRKLKEVVRVNYDNIADESWSSVKIGEDIPDSMFRWQPPSDWVPWTLPDYTETLLKPGEKAPDFDLASIDGERIKLSDFKGSPVWLCFWRLGCPPCRVETPFLEDLYQRHKDDGLVVLGVNVSDDRALTLDYLRELNVTFPNVLDTSEAAYEVCVQDYGGGGVPLNYLIDKHGVVVDAGFHHADARAKQALKELGFE